MHAAGVAHSDLKRKDNIIVGSGERPYLIDFGIAVRRSARNGLFNRLVFARLKQMDLNAWVKLKYGRRIDPETERDVLSAEDARDLSAALDRAARARRARAVAGDHAAAAAATLARAARRQRAVEPSSVPYEILRA